MLRRFAFLPFALGALLATAGAEGPVVVIDPGHPAATRDMGLKGKRVSEMEANYRVAALLVQKLRGQGVDARLTKPDIRLMLTNKRRAEIANWAKAKLFVRLHCDQTSGSGFMIVFPGAPGLQPMAKKVPLSRLSTRVRRPQSSSTRRWRFRFRVS